MATNRENATPDRAEAKPAAPRKESAVAPEATAQAARQTVEATTPPAGAPATPAPATPPAKATGPTLESKRKAARTTSGATRRPRAGRTAKTPAAATPRARAAATRAAAQGRVQPPVLAPVPAAAVTPLPAPAAPAESSGERAGHGLGRLNVELVQASRTAGKSVVDVVETTAERVASYQEQVAKAAPLPWVADLARANADFTRAATRAYVGAARSLLQS